MTNKISENTMKAIEAHLDRDMRAVIHFFYSPCPPEKFLREYFLMTCFEKGPLAALDLDVMLYHKFDIDIEDIVSRSERNKEYEEGGWILKMTAQNRKKIQHIMRVHNSMQDSKSIEINGTLIEYDSFKFARHAVVFFKMREKKTYSIYETTTVPYNIINEILVNERKCIYD